MNSKNDILNEIEEQENRELQKRIQACHFGYGSDLGENTYN